MVNEMARMMNFRANVMLWEKFEELQDEELKNDNWITYEIYIQEYIFDATRYSRNVIAPIWKTS